jgi:hypothetical protein
MNLWLALLIMVLAVAVLMGLLALYARRLLDVSLTAHFRAAEAISHGRTPAEWVPAISRQAALGRALLPWSPPAESALIARRVRRLRRFFERCPFFADEAARAQLLDCLSAAGDRWSTMTWDAIQSEAQRDNG